METTRCLKTRGRFPSHLFGFLPPPFGLWWDEPPSLLPHPASFRVSDWPPPSPVRTRQPAVHVLLW